MNELWYSLTKLTITNYPFLMMLHGFNKIHWYKMQPCIFFTALVIRAQIKQTHQDEIIHTA